jgi:hypothetical protein
MGGSPIPHWNVYIEFISAPLSRFVARICVSYHAQQRVVSQYTSQFSVSGFGAIADNNLPGVLTKPNANAAPMMK